jgi:dTDP-L-rhamnose 4-epimerase
MNTKRVLIVGGAGFIGSHLADHLLAEGHFVRILDELDPQVHGCVGLPPELAAGADFVKGDVRDRATVDRALRRIDVVFHLAASVGVGQSMYQIVQYTSNNALGTAVLLQALAERPVERLIVASSMSIYGEGLYRDFKNRPVPNVKRDLTRVRQRLWELVDADGVPLRPLPTPEEKAVEPQSVYALLKHHQERMSLCIGEAYSIPTVALRFFNTYGPRQALSNPYTGVIAIFASRILNNRPPVMYEDGAQQRDFVSVHDVAQACRLAMQVPEAAGLVFNVGSGCAISIRDLAQRMAGVLGKNNLEPVITDKYRIGDVRHCFADISRARRVLGYQPMVSLAEGLAELAGWLDGRVAMDLVPQASAELAARGLTL